MSKRRKKAGFDRVRFYVTGFGPFGRVLSNPTEHLVRALSKGRRAAAPQLPENSAIETTSVFHVSVDGTDDSLDLLYECAELMLPDACAPGLASITTAAPVDGGTTATVFVHFGVGRREQPAALFVETTAWNELHSSLPDESGRRFDRHEAIEDDRPTSHGRRSTLPLADIVRRATETFDAPVQLSDDPGRYLCNYVYYRSLTRCSALPGHYALFVHVPHVDDSMPIEKIIVASTAVLCAIAQELMSETSERSTVLSKL